MRALAKPLLAVAAFGLVFAVAELAARVWVFVRWPEAMRVEFTQPTHSRGRFASHPTLGYTLLPGFANEDESHDSRGLRSTGPRDRPEPPTKRTADSPARVVVMGASTVYGIYVQDHETSAAALERTLRYDGLEVDVFNAGVPGWTTRETMLSFDERVLPLSPDVVVVMDGRNEAFAQLWNGYRDDYTHYRDPGYQLANANAEWKPLFRASNLAMLFVHRGELFGFSRRAEHPLYGAIDEAAKPTPEQALAAAADPARGAGFERNLRALAASVEGAGASLVIASIPFRAEGFASGVLDPGQPYLEALDARVGANNAFARVLADELGVPFADVNALTIPALLRDDCHFNEEGEQRAGELLAQVVGPLLARRAAADAVGDRAPPALP